MIEGKLVRLRPQDIEDLDRVYGWINDREVTRHLNVRYPASRLAEEAWIRSNTETAPSYHNVRFAIDTLDGVHIGGINFHFVVPESRKGHLGIMIGDKRYWSQGYGTDAMRTLVRFGFEQMNLNRIELTVDAPNERAVRCYRKAGFTVEGRLRESRYARGSYDDQFIMAILREEWSPDI
jgi:RimJ/RimL family protein N-acetyltransferase